MQYKVAIGRCCELVETDLKEHILAVISNSQFENSAFISNTPALDRARDMQ